MSINTPVRRSTRRRAQSKRYAADASIGLDLNSSDGEDAQTRELYDQNEYDIREFNVRSDALQMEDASDDEDEDEYREDEDGEDETGESEGAISGNSRESTPEREAINTVRASSHNGIAAYDRNSKAEDPNADIKHAVSIGNKRRDPEHAADVRRRGLIGKPGKTSRDRLMHEVYGEQFLSSLRTSMNNFSQNLTFPNKLPDYGAKALAYPSGFADGLVDLSEDATKSFFPDCSMTMKLRSKPMKTMKIEDSWKFSRGPLERISLLMGPHQSQKLYSISLAETIDLKAPFSKLDSDDKRSWLIGAGGRVLSLSWAPKAQEGTQYLAVSVDLRESGKTGNPFVPSEGFPASIQIWRIDCDNLVEGNLNRITQNGAPQLVKVLCANWGTCRRLKWSPCAPAFSDIDGTEQIGLLGTVWTDGYARVLEVTLPLDQPDQIFWHCKEASFECRPPGSVCSCIEWLTPTDLATGCANGFVAIWDLSMDGSEKPVHSDKSSFADGPYFYHPFSETFILELACAGPESPHLLASISASGVQMLTDLRAPATDKVTFARSRVYPTCIRYSPHCHGFYTSDDQGEIAFLVARRFYSARRVLSTGATSAGGAIVATSPLHTSILVGTPDGTVTCTNPITKQLEHKNANAWSQRWFIHEWRDGEDYRHEDDAVIPGVTKEGLSAGTARITEGFRAEKINSADRRAASNVQPTVIYNNEQAITALEWNPNIRYGTWAAAATGSGLVRVEDVGV